MADDLETVDSTRSLPANSPLEAGLGMDEEEAERVAGQLEQVYMPDESSEEEEMHEDNKSVIMHIIKQLRPGCDLTRVTLPTFVLERRSLLEVFADFLYNPVYFVRPSQIDDPKERMLAVVYFYLTSFHSFRRGTIAKKPYNPILGETFHCRWDAAEDGTGETTYHAEQVSHHPPMSAFYFENRAHAICVNGHVWTKSKFLGTSVAAQMIGLCTIHLVDRDEVYELTFPDVYARSIFSVPKLELGGSVSVKCDKTAYSAAVEFKTKPMIKGKWHEVSAEVFAPGDRKAFCKIEGQWNGQLEAMQNGDPKTREPYFDAAKSRKVKKSVFPVDQQDPYESRRLWRTVTESLRRREMDKATEAKLALEQRQRDEKAARDATSEAWQQKLFALDGDRWIFKDSLHLQSRKP